MAYQKFRSCCKGYELNDPKEDYRSSVRVGQYRISGKAFYVPAFPGIQYIPFTAVSRAVLRNGSLPVAGCCGRELPVVKLRLDYDGGKGDFVIDPPGQGEAAAQMLLKAVPKIPFEDRR